MYPKAIFLMGGGLPINPRETDLRQCFDHIFDRKLGPCDKIKSTFAKCAE
jgi:hypothetical protein